MPLEVGEVMASCEARLLKQKIIGSPFTAKDIAEGALWDHLTQEDYTVLLKVSIILLRVTCDLLTHATKPLYFSLATSNSLVVATHIFSLFQRRAQLAAQADAIEASARELISKLPEEIPEEKQEARKEG